ncbi:hypothetical protein MTR_4g068820 [Medicago truncatula]|uniref:Uncharacterized protein n=1 Tax=Medicago truncatula TaxID=3880 RepID=A0A072UL25_MEDTR|nr:hypothetical protein MTR_4g068820 [Medicago truncatula]
MHLPNPPGNTPRYCDVNGEMLVENWLNLYMEHGKGSGLQNTLHATHNSSRGSKGNKVKKSRA